MSLPLVRLSGTPYEQGRAHGAALQDRVAHNVNVYFERFARETQLERPEALRRAGAYRNAIERNSPDYAEAMRGVADGAGFTVDEIAALNVRYEILYYQFGALAMENAAKEQRPDGCTAFAIQPSASANGHLLLGQNWDWIPQVRGAVLHTTHADGTRTLAFTEAGVVGGKIGLNSHGLGLCINGMTTTDDDWSRFATPFHVRCEAILRQSRFEDALRVITDEDRSCSTNFMVAQTPDQVADVEAAPRASRRLACAGGCLVHTNHFLDPTGMGIVEPPSERRPHSYHRRARMADLLRAMPSITPDAIQDALKDHEDNPFGLCRHEDWTEPPEEHYTTVASVVMDLHAGTMRITDGPPCRAPYEEYAV